MAKTKQSTGVAELANRSDEELKALVRTKRTEIHRAKFKQAMGQLPKTHVKALLRKDVARILTVLSSRSEG